MFQIYDLHSADTPPALAALREIVVPGGAIGGLGFAPALLIAGGAAATAAIASWLSDDDWSAGEYNDWMLAMDQAIHEWDKLGWSTGCWQKYPERRRQWLDFWNRFSTHYKEHGRVSFLVTDSEEKPARALMAQLKEWGQWLDQTCRANVPGITQPAPPPPTEEPSWTPIVKWGAIGLAAIVALNVISGVRGAFGPRAYY